MLSEALDLKIYSDVHDGQHELNAIYSLESLHKLTEKIHYYNEEEEEENRYIEGEYNNDNLKIGKNHELILIIDEIASYLNHFESSTVREKNRQIKIFSKLLRKASKCILLDADLMDIHIKYISDIINENNKNIILYNNISVIEIKTPVKINFSEVKMYEEIVERIKNGELVYICSDSIGMINKINLNLKKQITHIDFNEISKIYTKIDGNDNDFSEVNEIWKEKIILCSPKIIYGVDYNLEKTHHVYAFYDENNEIDVLTYYQQINRIRDAKSLNIFMKQKPKKIEMIEGIKKKIRKELIKKIGNEQYLNNEKKIDK